MKIVHGHPPNFEDIVAAFKTRMKVGIVYCYGDTIYNPLGTKLTDWIIAHERVHCRQQGADPAGWWTKYADQPQFRLEQELPAHCAEYRTWLERHAFMSRNEKAQALGHIARKLSGPLYQNMINFDQAKRLLST